MTLQTDPFSGGSPVAPWTTIQCTRFMCVGLGSTNSGDKSKLHRFASELGPMLVWQITKALKSEPSAHMEHDR
jgi:hypothetical protein